MFKKIPEAAAAAAAEDKTRQTKPIKKYFIKSDNAFNKGAEDAAYERTRVLQM